MKALHELRDMLCQEVEKLSRRRDLNDRSLDQIHKLTDTIKNIDKILMLEENGYSRDGDWEARGSYEGGNSYRRDSRGRYSRDGHSYDGYSQRYSRDGDIMHKLEELMANASTDRERDAIRECVKRMKEV